MAKRYTQFRDSGWNEHKKEEKTKEKVKKTRRSNDRKLKLSEKHKFIS